MLILNIFTRPQLLFFTAASIGLQGLGPAPSHQHLHDTLILHESHPILAINFMFEGTFAVRGSHIYMYVSYPRTSRYNVTCDLQFTNQSILTNVCRELISRWKTWRPSRLDLERQWERLRAGLWGPSFRLRWGICRSQFETFDGSADAASRSIIRWQWFE